MCEMLACVGLLRPGLSSFWSARDKWSTLDGQNVKVYVLSLQRVFPVNQVANYQWKDMQKQTSPTVYRCPFATNISPSFLSDRTIQVVQSRFGRSSLLELEGLNKPKTVYKICYSQNCRTVVRSTCTFWRRNPSGFLTPDVKQRKEKHILARSVMQLDLQCIDILWENPW